MRRSDASRARSILLVLSLAVLSGCAPYGKGMQPVLDSLTRGNAEEALSRLEKDKKEEDALWQLERGLLLRLVGRLEESSGAFDDADRIAEDLYTRSITNEAASLATNDRIRPYRPAAHELLLARYFQMLNYLERSDLEGALVEARRTGLILDQERDSGDRRIDEVAPLAHLLAGLVHEAAGDADDALVHYRRLFADAPSHDSILGRAPPAWLLERTWRLARIVGVDLSGELPEPDRPGWEKRTGFTAVCLFEQGFVPPRIEIRIDVPILNSESDQDAAALGPLIGERCLALHHGDWIAPDEGEIDYWLAIALPAYGPDPFQPADAWMSVDRSQCDATPFADVAAQAHEQLGREMPGIVVRTAIRTLTKYLLSRTAEKEAGELFGILTNALGAATEAAETRTWLTLPHGISVAAVELPETVESIDVHWFGGERIESLPVVTVPGTGIGFCMFRTWQ